MLNLNKGCIILWSLMTLLTGFVNSYWQLSLLRFGLGIGYSQLFLLKIKMIFIKT